MKKLFLTIVSVLSMFAVKAATPEEIFIDNTVNGIVLGIKLSGKKLTAEQIAKIRNVVEQKTPELVGRVKELGLYEDWSTQLLDPEIQEMNAATLRCKTVDEVTSLLNGQLAMINKKYPDLIHRLGNDPEVARIIMNLFRKAALVVED